MDLSARLRHSSPMFNRSGALLLACLVAGCGGQSDQIDKQLAALRTDVMGVRAENAALAERVDALEIKAGGLKGYQAPATPKDTDKPDLAVVRLAPEKEAETPPTDEGPRMVLRSNGKGGVIEEEVKGDDAANAGAAAEFAHAKDLSDKKNCADALTALSGFLVRYPDNAKAIDATYLRGECYLAKNDYRHAATDLDAVAKSTSDKAPDALFDVAKAYDKLGDKDSADKARKRLKSDFPKSAATKKLN